MATEIKSSGNEFSAELEKFKSINNEEKLNNFAKLSDETTFVAHFDELIIKSECLLPGQKAIIKVLNGSCEINLVDCIAGTLIEVHDTASVSVRTRYEQTTDLYIQFVNL